MAKKLDTIWELEPHTAAKHAILRRYLQAWIPILTRVHGRVVYIDGFAGPGVYKGGEDGSPIIALKSALEHAARIRGEIAFLFIELDPQRKASLEESVAALSLPPRFRVEIQEGRCAETIGELLDGLERAGGNLAPTFAFLDPFGFSHTPFSLIRRLMSHPRCEVLITFMYEEINRFLAQEQMPGHFDALFGCSAWAPAKGLASSLERKQFLTGLYARQLHTVAGIRFVRSFEMLNRDNRPDYHLFFATKSLKGLKKMKEAMWKVDETGAFRFSDATDPSQSVLFGAGPDPVALERMLVGRFKGELATIAEIEEFVLADTPYRETHVREGALIPMEKASPPRITIESATKGRKRFQYPAGTVIRFL
ncbi:MAG: three-Cys-motif partner protein TcmP [Gemmatimonadales bacterium]|nr:three-Cys-motif partner protein TcmP [Gemmatimonadales bacterium]